MVERILQWLEAFPKAYFLLLVLGAVFYLVRSSLELQKLRLEILKLKREVGNAISPATSKTPTLWLPPHYPSEELERVERTLLRERGTGRRTALLLFVGLAALGVVMTAVMNSARNQIGLSELDVATQLAEDARGALRYGLQGTAGNRASLVVAIEKATAASTVFQRSSSPERWGRARVVVGVAYSALDSPTVVVNQRRALTEFQSVANNHSLPGNSVARVYALEDLASLYLRTAFGDTAQDLSLAADYSDQACRASESMRGSFDWANPRMTRIQVGVLRYSRGEITSLAQVRNDLGELETFARTQPSSGSYRRAIAFLLHQAGRAADGHRMVPQDVLSLGRSVDP